jgi:transcriptional regulator with XRE-family HTH domain
LKKILYHKIVKIFGGLNMKFEEKLIKLRKENLLSQEELAEKLNVTRQTISKWELGQSKPDIEKLKEISSLFKVSIEQLTDDNNTEINKKIKEKDNSKVAKIIITITVIAVVIIITLIVAFVYQRIFKTFDGFIDDTKDIMNSTIQTQKDMMNTFNDMRENVLEQQNNTKSNMDDQMEEMMERYKNMQNKMNELL